MDGEETMKTAKRDKWVGILRKHYSISMPRAKQGWGLAKFIPDMLNEDIQAIRKEQREACWEALKTTLPSRMKWERRPSR
jgi:hypothetical protein